MSRAKFLNATVGEYRLVEYLGAGGMGEVYRGVHAKIGRVVAVKILNAPDQSPDFVERFLNEAQIQAGLHHHNIATLYDFLEFDGRPCIVMEYIDGQTLSDRLSRSGTFSPQEALTIFQALLEALNYVHGYGIVHRDIKSNNIKLTSRGQVKLLDFGIAKAGSTPNLTMAGFVVGTLEYLAPELVRGAPADARTDIWALGILLYELVTGRVPFRAANFAELYEQINRGDYLAPARFNSAVTSDVEAIIARCLRHNPAERYQSAAELLTELRRVTALPVATQPQPPVRTTQPTAVPTDYQPVVVAPSEAAPPSNRIWWVVSSVTALVLVVGLVGLYLLLPLMTPDESAARGKPSYQSGSPAGAAVTGELRTVRVDVFEGTAEVYRDGQLLGTTPYDLTGRQGERIQLILKCHGFADTPVEVNVTDNKKIWTYRLNKP